MGRGLESDSERPLLSLADTALSLSDSERPLLHLTSHMYTT